MAKQENRLLQSNGGRNHGVSFLQLSSASFFNSLEWRFIQALRSSMDGPLLQPVAANYVWYLIRMSADLASAKTSK